MPKGLPKSYIKKWGISKLAWKKFRAGALTKGIRTRTPAIKRRLRRAKGKNPKRRVRRTARRKKRGGGKSITRTAFKFIRLGALVANPIRIATMNESPETKITWIFQDYTGYNIKDGSFDISRMARGWGPYLMACLATYGIPKLTGILRRI